MKKRLMIFSCPAFVFRPVMAVVPEAALGDFPQHVLLPKKEIGADRFIIKYPDYDGRRTRVAIFDAGVDPAVKGLQYTSDGKRKIIDLIDCTGSGDVDTSIVRRAANGIVEGLSKRQLKIPESWNNPSGEFHVGLKSAYLLFPVRLKERLQKEVKEEDWDKAHNQCQAQATEKLYNFEKQHQFVETQKDKLVLEDCQASIDVLNSLDKKYKDPGPVYDCVVFHDGNEWCACVDTTETGDLGSCKLLRTFRTSGDYSYFSTRDMLTYSVNIYENGNILSIVTTCSGHGTHVASIAAGFHEDNPDLNGIAPGAQIISMKIGDTKLDSMETGAAMIRALIAAVENKVDVINMSYGEGAKWPNSGKVIEMINEVVKQHNIIFITSAGNDGPALSTVGAPCAATDAVIGVGAYVSSDMVQNLYSKLEKMPGKHYGWSSRGPSVDGSLGVCITAPGGAYTAVPKWTLRSNQLMNGTSMSSPNACGGVAVLVSALKAEGISYSPISIRRCLENTALNIEGASAFTQGHGMLQVDKAFDHMKSETRAWNNSVSFQIQCGNQQRGIYIREPYQHEEPCVRNVTVSPVFLKKSDNSLKLDFDVRACLISTVSWITTPSHIVLANSDRSFPIKITTDGLEPGCHFGQVCGYDMENPGQGALFRVPVTLIVPLRLKTDGKSQYLENANIIMKPGQLLRYFVTVPKDATWAEIELESKDTAQNARYLVQTVQLKADCTFGEHELHEYITLKPLNAARMHVKTQGDCTMELCIARWWVRPGESKLSFKLSFHGLQPNCAEIFLNGCESFTRVDVCCAVAPEEILPSATLTHSVLPLTPKESRIRPLGERDLRPDGKQIFELVLSYTFCLSKEAEVSPVPPLLHDLLYESEYASQFWMIFDQNKQFLKAGDAFPFKYKYSTKVNGTLTLLLQLRHDVKEQLEKMRNMIVNLYVKLSSPITLDCYAKREDIYSSNNRVRFHEKVLQPGMRCPVYITALKDDKFPKALKPGQYLTGRVTFAKQEGGKKVDSYPLQYMVPPAKCSNNNTKINGKAKDAATVSKNYEIALQDFMASWIPRLEGQSLQAEIFAILKENVHGQNVYLNSLDSSKGREKLEEIIAVSEKILALINREQLVSYYAMKTDASDNAAKTKIEMDKIKAVFTNALMKKGMAIADILLEEETFSDAGTSDSQDEKTEEKKYKISHLDDLFDEFMKWVEPTDTKMQMFIVRHGAAHKHYGRALKALFKLQEDPSYPKSYDDYCLKILDQIGWKHISKYLEKLKILKHPPNFEPF